MSSMSDPGLKRVFAAALTLFGRHGFRRTSMADIAREAGIARATLYLRFSEKRALFEALAASLVDEALARAGAAWVPGAPLSENIAATLLAKDLGFFRILTQTPHGAELLQLEASLTAVHLARLDAEFAALARETRSRGGRGRRRPRRLPQMRKASRRSWRRPARASSTSGATEEAFRSAIHRLACVAARAAGLA